MRRCAASCAWSRRGGPRWGYRQAHTHLRDLGWQINRKRVQRLWREEGLRLPQRTRKRRRLGASTAPEGRLRAERPSHVWASDFQFDQTADGHALKLVNVVDEFTREALVMHTARSISADQTVAVLAALVAARGAPTHIRCDNGPEMTAHALIDWCASQSTQTSYIDPGAPWRRASLLGSWVPGRVWFIEGRGEPAPLPADVVIAGRQNAPQR